MAAAPTWKVYDSRGVYQAACKEVEAAAALVAFYGDGASIRSGHAKRNEVWLEGFDGEAGASYDYVVEIVEGRSEALR